MPDTILTRVATRSGDNRQPVLCKEPAGLALGTDDFCFDFYSPDQYAAGAVPATGTKIADAAFANLAIDDQPLIGRAGQAVTLGQETLGNSGRNNFARGLSLRTGQSAPYRVRKAGLADSAIGRPADEGYRSFLIEIWLRMRSLSTSLGIGILGRGEGTNSDWGIRYDQTNGAIIEHRSGRQFVTGTTVDTLYHLGLCFTFGEGGATSTRRLFANGAEIGAATAGPTNAQWSATAYSGLMIGTLGGYDYASMDVARVRRVFTAWPGPLPALDPLVLHQQEEAVNRARFA